MISRTCFSTDPTEQVSELWFDARWTSFLAKELWRWSQKSKSLKPLRQPQLNAWWTHRAIISRSTLVKLTDTIRRWSTTWSKKPRVRGILLALEIMISRLRLWSFMRWTDYRRKHRLGWEGPWRSTWLTAESSLIVRIWADWYRPWGRDACRSEYLRRRKSRFKGYWRWFQRVKGLACQMSWGRQLQISVTEIWDEPSWCFRLYPLRNQVWAKLQSLIYLNMKLTLMISLRKLFKSKLPSSWSWSEKSFMSCWPKE